MNPSMQQRVDGLLRQIEDQQRVMERAAAAARSVAGTATSPDRAVTATINQSGELTDLAFAGTRYRTMPPAELSRVIMDTVNRARAALVEELTRAYAELVLPGLHLPDLLRGDIDLGESLRQLATERVEFHDRAAAEMFQDGQAEEGGAT